HAVSRFLGGTNHTDPDGYFSKWGYSMNDFFDLLKYYYDLQAGETTNSNIPDDNTTTDDTSNDETTNTDPVSQAPTGKRTLMHDAYTYNAQGQRTAAALKTAGTVVTVAQEKVINGKKYLQIGENEYVVASNIVGSNRVLTHNAYIYNTTGIRVGTTKLLKGKTVRTYGGRINIGGKMYYPIDTNRFVKVANFN
ncbi:MAG: SLAP domain-containing protein, partial [Lactobacillus sp.]|nr:SLAP domain-containing protein [Lactobacillus sp.]